MHTITTLKPLPEAEHAIFPQGLERPQVYKNLPYS